MGKEKMGELLALTLKSNVDHLKSDVPRPAPGIPLNSLPGWDQVPLYLKLPMLDCPGNEIIFTRGKIGYGLLNFQSDYDPSGQSEDIAYNALHDPHLKNFYSRKRNLDLLKKIGAITDDNDVICNLNEFNIFRRMLNRCHLFSIYKELQKREQDHQDRANIVHAETVAEDERKKAQSAQDNFRDPTDIKRNRMEQYQSKHEKRVANIDKIEQKCERIKKLTELKKIVLEQKKKLHNLAIEQHQIIANDLLRNRIIKMKRNQKNETDRSLAHSKNLIETRKREKMQKSTERWQKILEERTNKHKRKMKIIQRAQNRKLINIRNRKLDAQKGWDDIEAGIAKKAKAKAKLLEQGIVNKVTKKLMKKYKEESDRQAAGFDASTHLTKTEIRDAVNTAIDIEENKWSQNDNCDRNSVYEAARYILEYILVTVKRDLNEDPDFFKYVYNKIEDFFKYAKNGIIRKVAHVIRDLDDEIKTRPDRASKESIDTDTTKSTLNNRFASLTKFVSFNNNKSTIGFSSFQDSIIYSLMKMKSARSRTPTPAGSLTSIIGFVTAEDQYLEKLKRTNSESIRRDEKIFIEHFLVKFKRLLLVGIGKKVFEAIHYYKQGKIYGFNKELLSVDKHYLITIMAQSILSYNINKYNYKANLRLCISALSSDIIWEIQKTFMQPRRDTRNMKKPKSRCDCENLHSYNKNNS